MLSTPRDEHQRAAPSSTTPSRVHFAAYTSGGRARRIVCRYVQQNDCCTHVMRNAPYPCVRRCSRVVDLVQAKLSSTVGTNNRYDRRLNHHSTVLSMINKYNDCSLISSETLTSHWRGKSPRDEWSFYRRANATTHAEHDVWSTEHWPT